jgi:hypothetical protein
MVLFKFSWPGSDVRVLVNSFSVPFSRAISDLRSGLLCLVYRISTPTGTDADVYDFVWVGIAVPFLKSSHLGISYNEENCIQLQFRAWQALAIILFQLTNFPDLTTSFNLDLSRKGSILI